MFPTELTEIANKLVAYCNADQTGEALDTLYTDNSVSVEALAMGEAGREAKGMAALRAKHEWWFSNHEVHASSAEGPFLFGDDQFSVIFDMDVTDKNTGERSQAREVGVYTVKDGKILREEFYYPATG